jgi:hypothetical protein
MRALNIVLTLMVLAATHARPASLRPVVGLNVHRLDQRSVEYLTDLGISQIRYTLYWSLWDDPAYRLEWTRGLNRAMAAGLEPLIVVHQEPSGSFQTRQQVYRAFAAFVADRAAEFPTITAWQLWNEMDVAFTDVFGAGHPQISLRQRGRLYAEMLELAYPAIKRANPRTRVVTGGIASAILDGFLEGLYDGRARYDVLAIHTYGFPLAQAFVERGRAVQRIMRSHGDHRPLWNTEFGLERAVIPSDWRLVAGQVDSVQLVAWQTSVEWNTRERVYQRSYGYVLSEGKDLGFGLVRADGSLRPVYRWLKSWTRTR